MTRLPNRRVLVAALAISLMLPVVPLSDDTARAVGHDDDVCSLTMRNNPLWITRIDPVTDDADDEQVFTTDGAVFAEPGARLGFEVTIENRFDGNCPGDTTSLSDNVKVHLAYHDINYSDSDADAPGPETKQTNSLNHCDLEETDERCTATVWLPLSVSEGVQPASTASGEQRIRFVAYDTDANPTGAGSNWQLTDCVQDGDTGGNDAGACTGAERIIVTENETGHMMLPDLAFNEDPDDDGTNIAEDDPMTTYSSTDTSFWFNVTNVGTYPNWNPNGNRDADDDYWGHSPFDADGTNSSQDNGYGVAEEHESGDTQGDDARERNYNYNTNPGPTCRGANETNPGETLDWPYSGDATPRCSYRSGALMQVDVFYEIRRDDDTPLLEDGVQSLYTNEEIDDETTQKREAILPQGHYTNTYWNDTDANIELLDREKRAGEYTVYLWADQDGPPSDDDWFNIPEGEADSSEEDNAFDFDVNVLGVDLEIQKNKITVTYDGDPPDKDCTQVACPMEDAVIEYDPTFENVGDEEADGVLTGDNSRRWMAAVYLDGELIDSQNKTTPSTEADTQEIFDGDPSMTPAKGGGNQKIEIRLDHNESYTDDPEWHEIDNPVGRIGERTEGNDCAGSSDMDNRFCMTLKFVDQHEPEIQDLRILTESGTSQDSPSVIEGESVTFEADVKDSSLDNVTAFFEYKENGTEANFTGPDGETFSQLELTPVEGDDLTWSAETQLRGELTDYVYKVQAEDLNHTVMSDGVEFQLESLPIDITDEKFRVNGEANFGSEAPRYRGTADAPENNLNISVNITGTGHDEGDLPGNTSVQVLRPNGDTAAWASVKPIEKCMVDDGTPPAGNTQEEGATCQEARDSGLQDVNSNWTEYYTNSTDEDVTNGGIDMDWAGWFDVVVHVKDAFGRNDTHTRSGKIADRINPENNDVKPILEDASLTPKKNDPGDTIEVSASAKDSLRVENITLNITKPMADEPVHAELLVTEDGYDDEETKSGTRSGTFAVGPQEEFFDRGGTYDVKIAAEDFAGNFNETLDIDVDVNDTDAPTIVDFDTVPNGTQEVGGPITWVANIDDETAVQPPVLRVNRPTSGSTGAMEMEYNETEERWKLEMETSQVDVGTWTYNMTVQDYTGKQASADGEIRVAENLEPQATDWAPDVRGPDDEVYGAADSTVRVDVVDYGQGVNKDSIAFTVDDEDVTGEAEITTIDTCTKCYRLKYTPSEPFEANSTVEATVEAEDLSEPPQQSDTLVHQFQVDAEPPTPEMAMGPMAQSGEQRVIGIPTDIEVSLRDTASGPGSSDVTVSSAETGDSQTITLAGGEGTFRLQEFEEVVDAHGSYMVSVDAKDAVGNDADTLQRSVLFDKFGPSVDVFAKEGKPREIVFANVTDDSEIQKVLAKYSVDDGAEQTLPLEQRDDGIWSVRLYNQRTDQAFQEDSTVRFVVEATDMFGNVRSSTETNFTAGDSVPTVSFDEPQEGDTISGSTDVSWSADDAETKDENLRISLFYKKPGDTFKEIPGAQDIPNRGSYRLDTTNLPNGDVTLQVFVLDGQNFAADEVNVTVRNLGETFSAPEVEDADNRDGTNVLAPSQETTFRVQIDGDVRRAWANITQNGQVVQTIDLENTRGSTWQGTFVAPSERGNYSIDLSAVTADGLQETPSAYGFAVQGDAAEADNFIPEWTLLTALTATAVALGALGLRSRWT